MTHLASLHRATSHRDSPNSVKYFIR